MSSKQKPKLSTKEICETVKSEAVNGNHQLKAEVHELRAKLLKQTTELQEFSDMFHDVASLLFPRTTISKLRKIFENFNETHELQIPIKEGLADARTYAWTDERRAKFGAAVSAAWAAKRENEKFYVYYYTLAKNSSSFADKPHKHIVITGYTELAHQLGIPTKVKYLRDRIWLKPDGQTFKLSISEKVIVSLNKPITEKTVIQLREEFEAEYHKKHGVWPNEDQIPSHLVNPDKPKRGTKTKGMYNF